MMLLKARHPQLQVVITNAVSEQLFHQPQAAQAMLEAHLLLLRTGCQRLSFYAQDGLEFAVLTDAGATTLMTRQEHELFS